MVILGDGFLKIERTEFSITYRIFRYYGWVKFAEVSCKSLGKRISYDLNGVARGTFMSFGRVCGFSPQLLPTIRTRLKTSKRNPQT